MKSYSFNARHFGYLLMLMGFGFILFAYMFGASGESATTATTATTATETTTTAAETTTSQYNVSLPTGCDVSVDYYAERCSAIENLAVRQTLQVQLADIEAKMESLSATNIELLCVQGPDLWWEYSEFINEDVGPCLGYSHPTDPLYSIFFPCSNPNPRFEQSFPKKYWAGYYDSVDRSINHYFGCDTGFTNDVGISWEFLEIWRSRWALIFPNYKSLSVEHEHLLDQIEGIKANMPEQSTSTVTTRAVSKGSAISLSCRDGMVLAYCQVYWSDGSYRPLPMGIGRRRGAVVDRIIYYDLQWNPSCILLYADGSILTSYNTNNCN